MAANFCLPLNHVNAFKEGLKKGEIDPAKLSEMTSDDRRAFLAKYVGETSAKEVNARFESKLLLKNQKAGYIDWAKSVAGLKPDVKRNLITKIEGLQNVLDPEDKKLFLKDLAETKLGVGVTQEEAKTIMDLSNAVSKAKEGMKEDGTFATDAARREYGRNVIDMSNYVNELRAQAKGLKLSDFKDNPFGTASKAVEAIASNSKAITASMDNSAIFKQGWKTMWTHPGIWQKNARESFVNLVKQFGGSDVMREVNADIVSRPTYAQMMKGGLAVGNLEEAFPTTLPEKIPFIGRAYKASEAAYTAFVQKTRADVFDKYLEVAKQSGVDITSKKELQSIASMVNSLTGRGKLGRLEPIANTVNSVFFSPRFLKSNLDTLTQPLTGAGGSNFVRKQAATNLMKIIGGTAAVMATANALKPGSVELDPRSADFGKIRVGDTRFDISGSMGSIITLASRLLSHSSKSSTTGKVTQLNTGDYGSQTTLDVFLNFGENKLSPATGIIRDMMKGQDFNGNKPTVIGEAKNSLTPMGIQTGIEAASNPNSANVILTLIADGLGISANTYSAQGGGNQTTWEKTSSKEVTAFKGSVPASAFKKAAQQYDTQYNAWISGVRTNPDYKAMDAASQQQLITREKAKLQSDIFKQNGFKYTRSKSTINKSLLK